jgi:hypothetical protein
LLKKEEKNKNQQRKGNNENSYTSKRVKKSSHIKEELGL